MAAQIAAAESRLRIERDTARRRKPSYAVVPFQGRHGTRRRPVYIECRADEIVIQPAGIVLTGRDFVGPITPGNALAAGLRAMREELARRQQASGGDTVKPYPLLLVRPDGVEAYYAARKAIKSWGSEFGYELTLAGGVLTLRHVGTGQVMHRRVA